MPIKKGGGPVLHLFDIHLLLNLLLLFYTGQLFSQLFLRLDIRVPQYRHPMGLRRPGAMNIRDDIPALESELFNQPEDANPVFRRYAFHALEVFIQPP